MVTSLLKATDIAGKFCSVCLQLLI